MARFIKGGFASLLLVFLIAPLAYVFHYFMIFWLLFIAILGYRDFKRDEYLNNNPKEDTRWSKEEYEEKYKYIFGESPYD